MARGRRKPAPKKETIYFRHNEKIRAREVRVVGENLEPGLYSLEKALEIANEQGLDLVEISPNANPPVCRVVDYQKFIYEKKKKQKEIKSKTAKTVVKEIRFGPNTDDHDFEFKLKHAKGFLGFVDSKRGNKAWEREPGPGWNWGPEPGGPRQRVF